MAKIKVTCPCCKGRKRLPVTVHDDDTSHTTLVLMDCNHCDAKGEVEAEDQSDTTQPTLDVIDPAKIETPESLRKFELGRAAKRDHLLSIRTPPEDVDKILDELYGPKYAT